MRIGFKLDRWYVHPEIPWLAPGALQGAALLDLRAPENLVSVYEVDDAANVERIAMAIAAGRDDLDTVGVAIFDGDAVSAVGIQMESTRGTTADDVVNGLHRRLYQLTARQLVDLAGVIAQGWMMEILKKRVRELIKAGLGSKQLDRTRVSKKLLTKL